MKPLLLLMPLLLLTTGCTRPAPEAAADEPGARFSEQTGVVLTDSLRLSLGVEMAPALETNLTPRLTLPLRVTDPRTASAWIGTNHAALLVPGQTVTLPAGRGTITRITSPHLCVLGEQEVLVSLPAAMEPGTRVSGLADLPGNAPVLAVPNDAVLRTAQGTFVYTLSGGGYVRTPVRIAGSDEHHTAVEDGLYAGDEVVSRGAGLLWLSEVQSLRAGKACCAGQ